MFSPQYDQLVMNDEIGGVVSHSLELLFLFLLRKASTVFLNRSVLVFTRILTQCHNEALKKVENFVIEGISLSACILVLMLLVRV